MAKLPVEKMRELERRFSEIEARMSAGPSADVYVKLASEYSELQSVVTKIRDYERAVAEVADPWKKEHRNVRNNHVDPFQTGERQEVAARPGRAPSGSRSAPSDAKASTSSSTSSRRSPSSRRSGDCAGTCKS